MGLAALHYRGPVVLPACLVVAIGFLSALKGQASHPIGTTRLPYPMEVHRAKRGPGQSKVVHPPKRLPPIHVSALRLKSAIAPGVSQQAPLRPSKAGLELVAESVEPPAITNTILQTVNTAQRDPLLGGAAVVPLSLNDLIARTLAHSRRVQILTIRPAEVWQSVEREYGRFDWTAFMQDRFLHGEIPAQTSVEVLGTRPVIRQEELEVRWGLRRRNTFGGQIEISDTSGLRDEDSGILTPPDQGLSTVSLRYQQELLRNAGRQVNLSPVLVAQYQTDSAHAESTAAISDQVERVIDTYWTLFEQRGNFFVWQQLVADAKGVLEELEEREEIDAEENMLAQARALMLVAESEVAQARINVLLAQDALRRAVNDPGFEGRRIEIIPVEVPQIDVPAIRVEQALPAALANRGEIQGALADIRLAATRHNVSLNQLLPRLTFILETSANGLDGNDDIAGAHADAFDHDPVVEANVNLEFFIGNRRARATARQAQLALSRVRLQYEDEVEAVKLDVRNAVNRLNGLSNILELRYRTLDQRAKELDFLRYRTSVVPQANANRSLLLEQYFLALNRLVRSQLDYVRALTDQQRALISLQRAKGMLVRTGNVIEPEHVRPGR